MDNISNKIHSVTKKQILFGMGWSSLSTLVNGITQILRLSILSRFLEKGDFGIVAILTFISGLIQVFSDMGFSAAIMSQKNISKSEFLSLYWFQFLVFNFSFAVICCLAYPISSYYDMPSLLILIPIMLFELPLLGIGKLYDTVLQKLMLFKVIAIRNIIASLLSLILGIILAILNFGVYSFIISILFNTFIVNVLNFIKGQREYKINLQKIDFKSIKELIRVGIYQMGTQILDYLSSKLDIIIISVSLGTEILGIYNLAKELVLKLVMVINVVSGRVMLPLLAKYQENLDELKQIFMKFISKLILVNAPIVGFVFLFGVEIIQLFYGAKYIEAVPIVKVLSVWSIFVVLSMPNNFVAIVLKKTEITFVYTIVRIIIMSFLLYIFAKTSALYAAFTMLGTYAIMFIINWYMLLKNTLDLSFQELFCIIYKPLTYYFVTISVATIILYYLKFDNVFVINIIKLILYLLSFCAYLYFLERKTFVFLFRHIYKKL